MKKKKPTTPAVKLPVGFPKLTRTVQLRLLALQKEREQKQQKEKAEQQPPQQQPQASTPARAQLSSSCSTVIPKRRIATPLPVPSRGVRKPAETTTTPVTSSASTKTAEGKEAVRAKLPGKAAPGSSVIKARPAPNFAAIHQKNFSSMKSIFDGPAEEPSAAPSPSPPSSLPTTPTPNTTSTITSANRRSQLLQSSGKVTTTAARKRKLESEGVATPSSTTRLTRTTSEYGLLRTSSKDTEKKAPTVPKNTSALHPPASNKPKTSPLSRSTSSRVVGQKTPRCPQFGCPEKLSSSSKHTLPLRKNDAATLLINNENERNKPNIPADVQK